MIKGLRINISLFFLIALLLLIWIAVTPSYASSPLSYASSSSCDVLHVYASDDVKSTVQLVNAQNNEKTEDVTGEYKTNISKTIRPFDDYLHRIEVTKRQRFFFDDAVRTSMSLYKMLKDSLKNQKRVSPLNKTYPEIKKTFSSVWKKYFTNKVNYQIENNANMNVTDHSIFYADYKYTFMCDANGEIRCFMGNWAVEDNRIGSVDRVTTTNNNTFEVYYDLYRYDGYDNTICEKTSSWKIIMEKRGGRFKIQNIAKLVVYPEL